MNLIIGEILLMLVRAFFANKAEKELWEKRIQIAFRQQDEDADQLATLRKEDQKLKQLLRERKNATPK